jgi:hypothetical protein
MNQGGIASGTHVAGNKSSMEKVHSALYAAVAEVEKQMKVELEKQAKVELEKQVAEFEKQMKVELETRERIAREQMPSARLLPLSGRYPLYIQKSPSEARLLSDKHLSDWRMDAAAQTNPASGGLNSAKSSSELTNASDSVVDK